ncbi:hypothetical protein DERF_009030 [Dermatophagoides farinae]|uniref:Uncharacterized protein n=1 Tax=Dermatophagoides farinae TaxID=6954 RepID=A0A922HU21_DERFA|nr:hypothetical protein DERF_009030 [Dermatophagoides farinae]
MLPIMGVLLSKHSLTFAEDLVEDIEFNTATEFLEKAGERYDEATKTYVSKKQQQQRKKQLICIDDDDDDDDDDETKNESGPCGPCVCYTAIAAILNKYLFKFR